ncbi:MAG: ABC transporter substrate-binding protein [Candidatus Bathyarchaeota archaeon]
MGFKTLGRYSLVNSNGLAKIQSIILIAIIGIASIAVGVIYANLNGDAENGETIKIGLISDLDNSGENPTLRGAILAVEEINSEGGILGKQIELIAEDSDYGSTSFDLSTVSNALNRLLHYDKVDFVIGGSTYEDNLVIQDTMAEQKKIFISVMAPGDALTERVQNDYEKLKYFFKVAPPNSTALEFGYTDSFVALREYTGFNKIAYIAMDLSVFEPAIQRVESLVDLYDFEIVYGNRFLPGTFDFSSYFAAAEAAGAEIIAPMVYGPESISFVKEWFDRRSPTVLWGSDLSGSYPIHWENTDGKCAHETTPVVATVLGYPITTKTIPMIEDYKERWNEEPDLMATSAYEAIRFILFDALKRAGTFETEAVIKALEEVDIETPTAPHFVFTSSHDVMYGTGYNEQYFFQWQPDGTRVPMYPRELKEAAGVTYTYPDWEGPWS